MEITIGQENQFSAYIEGVDTIKLGREAIYKLVGNQEIGEVDFILEETNLAVLIKVENNLCRVKANDKNKLGAIRLKANYQGVEYVKNINIIPLW